MNRIILLRIIGICAATLFAVHAAMACYSDFVRPDFRASDLFSGEIPPENAKLAAGGILASVSLDGDLLANYAAAKSADVLHRPSIDAPGRTSENRAAQSAVITALKVSPVRPALWLTLGMLQAQAGEVATPAVKMSYLTGSVPIDVAFARVRTVTSTAAAADEEIKLMAQSDIRATLANRSRYEPLLIAAYVQATPQGKLLLLDTTKITDPKFNEILRRY
ncbi:MULTISPECIES: hypothetical protein [unclassified Bradyrhizobium]|uniref:hypothetical protein n=1 Tax=unclassified Bradyrhizobium TaxID=2631580 RepID=UPI00211ED771|nr:MULTISPECIES: hypothetical protein [unclassified Bradyrhizobium]MDD1532465.1 hypothetical protein [Bradyrhizobium sp. WBOS8]MDD1582469.1 hypothetical protein [Bradyrhizobium sp. WBOS4]UUO50884.1 hypothetical protein DCM78_30675 [Bradyrhizobium sp. WBOS04]UUO58263.1 hypothetical protein DCM80_03175 [Bradyrhizobium sp. WBOS08]